MPEQKTTKPKSGWIRQGEIGQVPYSAAAARRHKEEGWIRQGKVGKVRTRTTKRNSKGRQGGR